MKTWIKLIASAPCAGSPADGPAPAEGAPAPVETRSQRKPQ